MEGSLNGVVEGTSGKFVTKKLAGKIAVRPETDHISFALADDDKSAAVHVRKITLIRTN